MFTIYKYTSPSKRNYIGITMYPEVRKAQHRQKEYLFEDTTKFANAIRKYGFESMQYEVIDQAGTIEEACAKEIAWIKFYDSVESGYNILPGGIFAQSITHAERVVEDIRHLLRTTHKTQQQIASMFGVCVSYVSQVKNGKLRGNTVIERSKKSRKGETNGKAKLTDAQIIEIQ